MNQILENLKQEIKKIDISQLTSEMIQIPSYSFMDRQEDEISAYIVSVLTKEGIEATRTEIEPGRFNVTATLHGAGTGPSLMLSGHMDTVPAYDFKHAFRGEIVDGKVFGRGACDMKGPLASMMSAMIGLKKSGIHLAGDLIFTALSDEEEKGHGVAYLIKHGPYASGVIMGEPNDMKIALGHKGLEWIEVKIQGKKVHGGNKKDGINAIAMAGRFINKIYNEYEPLLNSREYPVLGAPTINLGTINGGDQPSTVPDRCTIRLDRRCVPTETIAQVYDELKGIIAELSKEDPKFQAEVDDVFHGETLPHEPFCTSPQDPLVKAAEHAIRLVGREQPSQEAFPAWTDAGFINSGTNSACLVMGPGDLSVAHSVHEYISTEDLNYAALVYAYIAMEYCGLHPSCRLDQ